jgi:hypothetical protein
LALACQRLEKVRPGKTRAELHLLPPGLQSLYERMMEQIHGMEDGDDVHICLDLLAIMLKTYRPLTLEELAPAVDPPQSTDNLEKIVRLCGSFVIIQCCTVFFVHQSAKDFLVECIAATSAIRISFIRGYSQYHYML